MPQEVIRRIRSPIGHWKSPQSPISVLGGVVRSYLGIRCMRGDIGELDIYI